MLLLYCVIVRVMFYCCTSLCDVRLSHLNEHYLLIVEEDFHIDREVRCEGAHPLCGALSRRGLKTIKLAYDPRRPDGRSHSGQRL